MGDAHLPRGLVWAQEIQALAQTSAHYAENDFQRQRYHRRTEIAAEIVSKHYGWPASDLMEVCQAQGGYVTPKVDVRAAVFDDQARLLLVREISDGGWTLPGGWAGGRTAFPGCRTGSLGGGWSSRARLPVGGRV